MSPHAPAGPPRGLQVRRSDGRFERVLRSGRFAVTAELNPPDSADPQEVFERATVLAEVCDAINAVDASGANVHMSSIAIAALLSNAGYACVLQIACRDRNRIAIQGEVLGAAALGVLNILCLTGDGVQCGDHPDAKPVFDLDSISLLETISTMREKGCFLTGRKLTTAPRVLLGAAVNPFAPPHDYRPLHMAKKIEAGADFIQTQYVFDLPQFERFMARVRDRDLHRKCFVLAGVGPLVSARAARWMRSHVPGVHIPDALIERLEKAGSPKAARREGKALCIELIQRIREIEGVSGVHVMAYRQEELVSEIIEQSGVLEGRRGRALRPKREGRSETIRIEEPAPGR